jgi:hypothetical protein
VRERSAPPTIRLILLMPRCELYTQRNRHAITARAKREKGSSLKVKEPPFGSSASTPLLFGKARLNAYVRQNIAGTPASGARRGGKSGSPSLKT